MRDAPGPMPTVPKGAATLRALLLATLAQRDGLAAERDAVIVERDTLAAERDALLGHNERLHHLLLKLRRMQFGARSEHLPEDQLQLGFKDLEGAIAEVEARAEKCHPDLHLDKAGEPRRAARAPAAHRGDARTRGHGRSVLPGCDGGDRGTDTAERLDVVPAQFRVLVTHRPKLACRTCEGVVVQSPAPRRLIEGGLPTEALVAHVLVSRYADHLPLYRQAQIMGRQGVPVDRATLAYWVGYGAAKIAPVVARVREMVLGAARVFADETVVPVLDPGRGRTKQGYLWTVARDDRPWGGADPPVVVYSYAPGRGHQHAHALLGGYRGILQCDGYAAYKALAKALYQGSRSVTHWACPTRR